MMAIGKTPARSTAVGDRDLGETFTLFFRTDAPARLGFDLGLTRIDGGRVDLRAAALGRVEAPA
ncbi:hypothetical protein D9M68_848700 [compost metagenome]